MNENKIKEVLFDLFKGTLRQGPGRPEDTRRALSMLPALGSDQVILDIGCGTGAGTAELWRHSDASIVAVDLSPSFIGDLQKRVNEEGHGARVKAEVGDMGDLGFEENHFDLIWAEGSIFIIGFEQGFRSWRPLLKDGGYIAVTEVTWLKEDVPAACREFWQAEYPSITSIDANLSIITSSGYEPISHFTLSYQAWLDYYAPIRERLPAFMEKYRHDKEGLAVLDMMTREIEVFDRYSSFYGYVFYLARKL